MAFSKAFVALALAVLCVHLLSHGILARQFAEINSEATTMKSVDSRNSETSSSNSSDLGGTDQQYGSKGGSGIGPNNKNKNSGLGGSSNDATDDDETEFIGSNSKHLSNGNVGTKKTNNPLGSNHNSDGDIAAADHGTETKTNVAAVASHKRNSSGDDNVDMPKKKTAVEP